ncbi:motility protein A [Pseudotabrizicola algicola]|uniref:Flagellar motor protein PomA n=1 Tax=Pseudotabrizicola algicola TaxID=2709381 RepID=A0A6B3RIM9_9RHOB|nr:MotA/TolQ/ExbB proton channel family protein [Pseudotabrizicola algicola]NEX45271.1 flagellar motor protein PomA [Pseudotabrizicola algicola]
MDIAALIGFIGAIGMIIGAMIFAGGVGPFIDIPSILIVFGGTAFSALSTTSMPAYLASFKAMGQVFKASKLQNDALVKRMIELSAIARKDGMMALEGQAVPDKFFEKGLQMLVDGADEAKIVKLLKQEVKAMKSRHESAQGVVKAWVDIGPAMGMIGTLIGLVLMLGNMSDVKAIGPAMAVALLTTLYGAMVANVIFGPILTKLQSLTSGELEYRALVIEGLRGIARGDSPRIIEDQMIAALEPPAQAKLRAAA